MIVMILGLCACGEQPIDNNENNVENNNSNEVQIGNNNETEENAVTTNSEGNALVVYFSWANHTEKMASVIAAETGADVAVIEPVNAYPTDYNECTEVALEEQRRGEKPAIKDLGLDLEDYDVIYLGYPIWWMDMPQVLYTFLENNDFSGKTIYPFTTSYSSGIIGTFDKIKNIATGADVEEGLHIFQREIDRDNYEETIKDWLK